MLLFFLSLARFSSLIANDDDDDASSRQLKTRLQMISNLLPFDDFEQGMVSPSMKLLYLASMYWYSFAEGVYR